MSFERLCPPAWNRTMAHELKARYSTFELQEEKEKPPVAFKGPGGFVFVQCFVTIYPHRQIIENPQGQISHPLCR